MASQWFENFFHGIVTELWEQCVSSEQTAAEADMLERQLNCKAGRILDVACGNGRHSLVLAQRGFAVTGLDISTEFIEKARRASEQQRLRIEWVCEDMRKFNRQGEFDAAFCLGNSFGYLEHEDTVAMLRSIARALKPKGRFLLQAGLVAECLLPRFRDREWYRVGEILFLEENKYHFETSCVETDYTFVRNGKVEQRHGKQHVYSIGEIRRMLRQAGLEPLGMYSTTEDEAFEMGDPVTHFVAQKI